MRNVKFNKENVFVLLGFFYVNYLLRITVILEKDLSWHHQKQFGMPLGIHALVLPTMIPWR